MGYVWYDICIEGLYIALKMRVNPCSGCLVVKWLLVNTFLCLLCVIKSRN